MTNKLFSLNVYTLVFIVAILSGCGAYSTIITSTDLEILKNKLFILTYIHTIYIKQPNNENI